MHDQGSLGTWKAHGQIQAQRNQSLNGPYRRAHNLRVLSSNPAPAVAPERRHRLAVVRFHGLPAYCAMPFSGNPAGGKTLVYHCQVHCAGQQNWAADVRIGSKPESDV